MLDIHARGVYVIAVTPFTETGGSIRRASTVWSISTSAAASRGITVLGMMGEAPKLDA